MCTKYSVSPTICFCISYHSTCRIEYFNTFFSMAFLPQIHNTEVITKLLIISNMVFCIQCPVHHDCWHGGDCCYIYILYEGVTLHYVIYFGLAQTHALTREAHTLPTPLEWQYNQSALRKLCAASLANVTINYSLS